MTAPDLVLTGATVITLDAHDTVAGALAVTGGLITAVGTAADVMAALHATQERNATEPGGYVVGWGYYPESMTDGGRLTATMLDEELPDHRVVVVDVSGHGGVVNGPVLADAGYRAGTPDPQGGTIGRHPGTDEPDGVLWEQAWMPLMAAGFLDHGREELDAMLAEHARWGTTTVQDGASSWPQVQQVRAWAAQDPLPLDVRSLVTWTDLDRAIDARPVETTVGGPSGQEQWHGLANTDAETTDRVVETAYRHGFQVFAHVNGDAAIDRLLDAHRAAVAAGASPVAPPGRSTPR